jgi:arylsulfatase A-like enzyme
MKRSLITLILMAGFGCSALLAGAPAGATQTARRPNIIVMVTDDQRHDALGVVQREQGDRARFPFFETPHLDRLAAGGARFRNAFVTHSLCSPSRASMLTGLQTSGHGIRDNRTPFRSLETWAAALGAAGYRTGYFGKWHMGRQEDRPGFAEVFTFVDQGDYPNCRVLRNGVWEETQGWVDDVTTTEAIAFIGQRRAEPFAMTIGYKSPHDPRQPPARHAERYAGQSIAEPASFRARPPFPWGDPNRAWNPTSQDRLNYFRCLRGVDDNVGRILAALAENGLLEDTLILFAGDNGYYLGEHGLGDKRSAYEESIRIPLLAHYPRYIPAGTVVDALTLNVDLAPTILEVAGVAPGWRMQGASLVPLFGGAVPAEWRKEFLYENYQDPEYPAVTFDILSLRTEFAKRVEYPGRPEWTQVFDLRVDPLEMRNLAQDPSAAVLSEELRVRLAAAVRQVRPEGAR